MNETEGDGMSREELLRELTKAGEETAAMELDGVIARAQLRFAKSAPPPRTPTPPPKAAP
jgi:hypothetical protein